MAKTQRIAVGAVAYDPKVVTIWEMINDFFRARGIPSDYVLFSNYEAQVEALLSRSIDIAWNTNLAYVRVHRRSGGRCKVLAMRDTDVEFTSILIAGTNTGITSIWDLRGKRLAFGSRDSGQAAILPEYFLGINGIDVQKDVRLTRFDLDVGKHGDTGTSEVAVLEAVTKGEADAGAVGDTYWARTLAAGGVDRNKVKPFWTSSPYCHCNFSVLEERYGNGLAFAQHENLIVVDSGSLYRVRLGIMGKPLP
ncbi:MAG: phosphate ABC transporter substrate-binding protein [Acidobacteria bacterium]|nr:MAG: phosphate ABC transporter substrate-binding protein [Acidobacteriota bacterium]